MLTLEQIKDLENGKTTARKVRKETESTFDGVDDKYSMLSSSLELIQEQVLDLLSTAVDEKRRVEVALDDLRENEELAEEDKNRYLALIDDFESLEELAQMMQTAFNILEVAG